MLRHSEPLVGKEDKYVNGYGPESESEEEEQEQVKEEKIEEEEEEEEEKKYNDINEKIDETIDKIDELLKELELLNEKLQDENDNINKINEEIEELDNNHLNELKIVENLEGGALKNTLSKVKPDYPEIMSTIYSLVEHYIERHRDVGNEIKKLQAQSTAAFVFFNNVKDGILKKIDDIKKAIEELKYEKKELKTCHLLNVRANLPERLEKVDDKISDAKEKLKKEIQNFKNQVKHKNDAYNKLNNYKYNAETGYANIVYELTEKYNTLKDLLRKNKPIKKYNQQTELHRKVDDVLDLVEELDKNALKSVTEEGKRVRAFFSQLIRTGNIHTSHKKLSYVDTINKEDGNRNEFLFKSLIRPSAYPQPSIEINRGTYYNKYDLETPDEVIELKTSNEESLDRDGKPYIDPITNKPYDNEKSFFIGKDKIDNIIKEAEDKNKKPKIFWYLQKKKGYLTSLTETELNKIDKQMYKDRLYTLSSELDENTFKPDDLVSRTGNIKEETYMLRLSDDRIRKFKSKTSKP